MSGTPFGYFREECTALAERALKEAGVKADRSDIKFSIPKDFSYGNLSLSTFSLSKAEGLEPRLLAERIVEKMGGYETKLVSKVQSAGVGYVNFFIDYPAFNKLTLETILAGQKDYGRLRPPSQAEKVLVEHTSVNPIHPIHVGGARNAVIGDCLARILVAAGKDVKRHFYIDDVGLQVSQTSYGFSKVDSGAIEGKSDHFVGQIYAATSCSISLKKLKNEIDALKAEGKDNEAREKIKELDDWIAVAAELRQKNAKIFDAISDAVEQDPDPEGEAGKLLKRYESREAEAVRLVRRVSDLALDGFRETLGRVGISFDSWDWESEIASWTGKAGLVVEDLCKTNFVKVEKGTVTLDAELAANTFGLKQRYGIKTEVPPLTLKRSDGTTLYTTRDIAYTLWKFERAHKVINVISIEQKLPQLQLKIALYALGKGDLAERLVHFSYELVHLPGFKMSGRRGRFVAFDDVLRDAVERAYREVSTRSPHLSEEEKRRISEVVGLGAVRYAMIAVASNKPITFTWDKVLNFEQNSAPFIQYAHARASNILVKASEGRGNVSPDPSKLATEYENELIVKLGTFPDAVEEAANTFKPEMIAEFANDLASKFNLFYDNVPVIKTEDLKTKEARLCLVEATKIVLANSLFLLGIEAPARM